MKQAFKVDPGNSFFFFFFIPLSFFIFFFFLLPFFCLSTSYNKDGPLPSADLGVARASFPFGDIALGFKRPMIDWLWGLSPATSRCPDIRSDQSGAAGACFVGDLQTPPKMSALSHFTRSFFPNLFWGFVWSRGACRNWSTPTVCFHIHKIRRWPVDGEPRPVWHI
ncbi:hypothetical protein B0J18DRAFT_284069 [Chaetomium sp. MPI-SDFR-AT-0129]|nr:hypothetical protein B0J18DRAFT_284069 [Chaetomium sp. MPI-SDFR-AT-0129]